MGFLLSFRVWLSEETNVEFLVGTVAWIQGGHRGWVGESGLPQLSALAWLRNRSLHGNGVRVELNMPLLTFDIPRGAGGGSLNFGGEKEKLFLGTEIPESGMSAFGRVRSDEMREDQATAELMRRH